MKCFLFMRKLLIHLINIFIFTQLKKLSLQIAHVIILGSTKYGKTRFDYFQDNKEKNEVKEGLF